MAELVARDKSNQEKWRHRLPSTEIVLGRHPEQSDVAATWDTLISRRHVNLKWEKGKLHVKRRPEGRNSVFFGGESRDDFLVAPGEHFAIGESTFTVEEGPTELATPSDSLPAPFSEFTLGADELHRFNYVDAAERIEALTKLPLVVRDSRNDQELEERVLDALLRGISRAEVAGIVRLDSDKHDDGATGASLQSSAIKVHVEVRRFVAREGSTARFQPSRRLVIDAVRKSKIVLHIWDPQSKKEDEPTAAPDLDWALCAPLPHEPQPYWALYVAGKSRQLPRTLGGGSHEDLLKSDMKFAELTAETFGALRQTLDLQRRHAQMSRFFSRPVLAALADRNIEEVLKPRQVDVTVLFCDLRGSCHIAEVGEDDLQALWQRVSAALGIMAQNILDQDGVIGDFQGDAAMGFWGWPLAHDNQVERAARAALNIYRDFTRMARYPGSPLEGFTCGIGIAHGPAIAGRLGTSDQFKVDVFGPTVNLAARLESLTKVFRVPIVIDEQSAEILKRDNISGWGRCRALAKLQPFGMKKVVLAHELLPAAVEANTMREDRRHDYEMALEALLESQWDDARRLLERLHDDGPAQFLRAYIDRHKKPPANWDGVIVMDAK